MAGSRDETRKEKVEQRMETTRGFTGLGVLLVILRSKTAPGPVNRGIVYGFYEDPRPHSLNEQ